MSNGGLLGVGLSGLQATQRAISTASHNISNANTEGYSRQRVHNDARAPTLYGNNYIGNGVDVRSVERMYDSFLVGQVRDNTSAYNSIDSYHALVSRIDNLLADSEVGLGRGLENFFGALQELANDPASHPARQVVLSEANMLVQRFQSLEDSFASLHSQANSEIEANVSEINTLASGIADLNQRIVSAMGAAGRGGLPNDLLDQRDVAVAQLAKLATVSTTEQDNGAINVFIGSGQSLVVGAQSQNITITRNHFDPTRYELGVTAGSTTMEISALISGGKLGGLLNFRDQVLDPAANALGRVALGLATTFNTQHHLGMDLSGALGGDFFAVGSPEALANNTNAGTGAISAALVNVDDLQVSDYRLAYDGGNSYTLTRLSDAQTTTINTGGTSPYTTATIDGFSLTIASGAVAGDSFMVRPTRTAVNDLSVRLVDPAAIAAAAPVRTASTLNNLGNATISAGSINHPDNRVRIEFNAPGSYDVIDEATGATLAQNMAYSSGSNISYNGWVAQIADGAGAPAAGDRFYVDQGMTTAATANTGGGAIGSLTLNPPDANVADPVTITFTAANMFTVTGATSGTPTVNVPYTSGEAISYNGWSISISGAPAPGDTFTIGSNANGVGDNRNALQLTGLQTQATLGGGTASYQDAYGRLVADVGSKTHEAEITRTARQSLLNQSIEAREAVSGVNLDEEAAELMRLQQVYQAVAQIISVTDTLFTTLLDAVRR